MSTPSSELWDLEYCNLGLPTSRRAEPSRAAEFFLEFLLRHRIPLCGRMLDLGCGSGRNTFFFAKQGFEVHGMDFSATAQAMFHRLAAQQDPAVTATSFWLHRIDDVYPFEDQFFDHSICFTAIENLLEREQLRCFQRELARVLRPHGYFAIYFLTNEDGFYGPRVERGPGGEKLVRAEDSGLMQRVHNFDDIVLMFHDDFEVCDARTFRFLDERYGVRYQRHLEAVIFCRR